jgi:hypothetical protein
MYPSLLRGLLKELDLPHLKRRRGKGEGEDTGVKQVSHKTCQERWTNISTKREKRSTGATGGVGAKSQNERSSGL